MTDLRAEEIREALTWDTEYVDAVRKGDPTLTFEPFEVIVAAARAWLASLEQEPDYEAATIEADKWRTALNDFALHEMVKAIIDAAGFRSQSKGDNK